MTQHADRRAALGAALPAERVDALLVASPENRRYLTGFTGSAGLLVVAGAQARLVVDGRYVERAREEAPDVPAVPGGTAPMDALAPVLAELGAVRVGFEAEHVTVAQLGKLEAKAPDATWVPTTGLVERLRLVKSPEELAALRRALALTDRAMEHAWAVARPGTTERELAWRIEAFMREHGAEGVAFDLIVAAGANGALPHHAPGDRPIAAGEPIVVDIGARVDGYHGDLTRTFSLGPATDPDYEAVWRVVEAANHAGRAALRAGVTGIEVDRAARAVIEAAGYGDAFGHGLGHGVGLQIHEGPRLSPAAENVPLVAGSVVTIEPGIYLPGRFGVRLEDVARIGPDGAEILTGVPTLPVLEAHAAAAR